MPSSNEALQLPGQSIPEGRLVTVPLPCTSTVSVWASAIKRALSVRLWVRVSVQLGAVASAQSSASQPAKLEPAAASA